MELNFPDSEGGGGLPENQVDINIDASIREGLDNLAQGPEPSTSNVAMVVSGNVPLNLYFVPEAEDSNEEYASHVERLVPTCVATKLTDVDAKEIVYRTEYEENFAIL
jgi:hypothetical protein